MSFAEIAGQRFLTSATSALDELQWNVEPDPYQAEELPETGEIEPLLQMMARRGLDPAAVRCLLNSYPDRPLERALIAWDVLRGSLLGSSDSELLTRVSRELAPLKQLGAKLPVAFPRDHVAALLDAARPPADSPGLFGDFAALPSLAAVVQLTEVRKTLDDQPGVIQALFAHVKRLELAHLPSLAIAFLQILWDRFALEQALDLLIEVALDHGMIELIPPLDGTDDRAVQRRTYTLVRSNLDEYNVAEATRQLDRVANTPAIQNSKDPALALARIELALMNNQRLDPQTETALQSMPAGWRYAARVKYASRILANPDTAASSLNAFITSYGNNLRVWGYAALKDDQKPALLALLSREVRYSSHDPEVWRALSIVTGDGEEVSDEIEMRLATQSLKVVGLPS
jgi:hypothetical protein